MNSSSRKLVSPWLLQIRYIYIYMYRVLAVFFKHRICIEVQNGLSLGVRRDWFRVVEALGGECCRDFSVLVCVLFSGYRFCFRAFRGAFFCSSARCLRAISMTLSTLHA